LAFSDAENLSIASKSTRLDVKHIIAEGLASRDPENLSVASGSTLLDPKSLAAEGLASRDRENLSVASGSTLLDARSLVADGLGSDDQENLSVASRPTRLYAKSLVADALGVDVFEVGDVFRSQVGRSSASAWLAKSNTPIIRKVTKSWYEPFLRQLTETKSLPLNVPSTFPEKWHFR
jgi:uncharacterized protein YjiK